MRELKRLRKFGLPESFVDSTMEKIEAIERRKVLFTVFRLGRIYAEYKFVPLYRKRVVHRKVYIALKRDR